jgi:hypothetical protein
MGYKLKQTTMKRTPVTSGIIESIGYDEPSKTMQVKFIKGGFPYEYYNISTAEYRQIIDSTSVGATLKQVVQGKRYKKVT